MLRLSILFALFASACVDDASATTEAATGSDSGSDHCRPPLPPKEAVDACASLAADATCAFDIDGHHVTGTCKHGPSFGGTLVPGCDASLLRCGRVGDQSHSGPEGQGPLACAPDHPPPLPPPTK